MNHELHSMGERFLRLSHEENNRAYSVSETRDIMHPVIKKAIMTRIIGPILNLPVTGVVLAYAIMSDMTAFQSWIYGIISVFVALMSIAAIVMTVSGISGLAATGSTLMYAISLKYRGLKDSLDKSGERGEDVEGFHDKIDQDYEKLKDNITSLVMAFDVDEVFDNIDNNRDEFDTSVEDISEIMYLRNVSNDLTDVLDGMSIEELSELVDKNDDDSVRYYIAENVNPDIAHRLDLKEIRGVLNRLSMLEEITVLRYDDNADISAIT